jgi:hypothetical protein
MTEAQLDAIEAALGMKLPAEYRRVSREFPFRPIGRDSVYWFSDDPEEVIGETLAPLSDGGYDRTGWRDTYLAIGHSAAGDLYLVDTAAAELPVSHLSHETHAIEVEWPTFAAFVEEWLRAPEEVARRAAAQEEAEDALARARMRQGVLLVAGILVVCLTIPLVMAMLLIR